MLRSAIIVLLFAFSTTINAQDLSYNYVDAAYSQTELDDFDVDGDSIGISGAFEINENFFLFAGYGTGDLDDGFGTSVDIDQLSAGVGYHIPLSGQVDLVTGLSYEYVDLSVPGFGSVDDNGFGLSLGLRFAATEQVELNVGIKYIDLSDSGDDTGFGIGGLYNFTENVSVGLSGNWTDDTSTYGIGGRFYFGQ
ncbi:MAG: outer membrane beta-barrel protein [Woeseia sp.]